MSDDKDDLRQIRQLLQAAVPTLLIQTEGGTYPYEVGKLLELPRKLSASTNSMVAHSVACVGGFLSHSRLVGFPLLPDRDKLISSALFECAKRAVRQIIQQNNSVEDFTFESAAFGFDDPFTIGWMFELLEGVQHWGSDISKKEISSAQKRVHSAARRRVVEVLKAPDQPVLKLRPRTQDGRDRPAERAVVHPLPLLRIVQIANLLDDLTDTDGSSSGADLLPNAFEWFLTHLHLQLSRRNIQHSGFDIAELVFCLEGMLEAGRSRVTRSILDSVVAALNESRQLNSALRATTPFKVSSVGAVHLFTSVEVVASLLRSATLLERQGQTSFFAELKPTLRHYLAWLQATMLEGETALPEQNDEKADCYPEKMPLKFAGWHSEHAHTDDNSVHVWITSQVILFLRSYETLLSRDVAEAALRAAGVRVDDGNARRVPNPRWPPASDLRADARRDDPLQLADDSPYRVISRLHELFVSPRVGAWTNDAPYSCLLYGPPGTGKTTLARGVATALGWPLLTITTSDFIIDGEAQVEARAKKIFTTLGMQSGLVIFFDEIDRLLLDRDKAAYGQQGDMLQFMTPSMLTKINDLRQDERCIFIIGTNYADRIDRAIKRAGRIDHKFLVLPPDERRRQQIIKTELHRVGKPDTDEDAITSAARAGAGRTIAELQSAVRAYARQGGELVSRVTAVVPALSLTSYTKRIKSLRAELSEIAESSGELLEEAYLIAYLLSEGMEKPGQEYEWFAEHWVGVKGYGLVQDPDVAARLDTLFGRDV